MAALLHFFFLLSSLACVALGSPAAAQETAAEPSSEAAQERVEPGVAAKLNPTCEADDAEACTALGFQLLEGDGIPKDEVRSSGVFAQACLFGSLRGCTMAGNAYGGGNGVEADAVRAASYYAHACEGGEFTACNNLGLAYVAGNGVPEDEVRATVLFKG